MSTRGMIAKRWTSGLMMVLALGALVSLTGCGGAHSTVSGNVTYDGQPIENGSIRLNPTGGTEGQGGAAPIVNGRYEMKQDAGLSPGQYAVTISAFREATAEEIAARKDGEEREEEEAEEDGEGGGGASAAPAAKPTTQYLPAKYNQASELKLELAAGENTKDFALEK